MRRDRSSAAESYSISRKPYLVKDSLLVFLVGEIIIIINEGILRPEVSPLYGPERTFLLHKQPTHETLWHIGGTRKRQN